MAVIIVTNKGDVTADYVVRAVRARGHEPVRLNLEDAPQLKFSFEPGCNTWRIHMPAGSSVTRGEDVTGVWLRQGGWIELPDSSGSPQDLCAERFVNHQWWALIKGLGSLPQARWVSAPEVIQRAECKLIQLRAAVELGLAIPKTLITNDAEALRQFRAEHPRGVIVKAVASPLLSELNQFVFTHRLEEHTDLCDLEVQIAPLICQEAVTPKRDIRVAVVGERYFAAELESAQDDHIDWRVGPKDRPWRPVELPADLGEKLVRLVAKLKLAYAGIDLLHHDKGFCFVEANPNGEWGWLRAGAGLPIDEALAEYLIG